MVASVTWPSRSCALLKGELWQPPAWIFLPLYAARFIAPETWGNYIQEGTSQKYYAVKWIAAFCKEQLTSQTRPKWILDKSYFSSVKKLKKGRETEDCLTSSSWGPLHQAILANRPPPSALTRTAQDCLQPTCCQAWLSTICTRQPFLLACCCCSGLRQFKWQTRIQALPKAKPHVEGTVCIWTWSKVSKSSFFLHILKQEPGNIFKRFFFLIPAYTIYKGLAICKHPQSTRCALSFCFLRFHVCLHYSKSK